MSDRTWSYPVRVDHTDRPVVVEVHDGDTFRLLLDAGCETGLFPWLRLASVGAPELDQPGGPEATAWVLQRLSNATHIEVTVRGRSFARWLATVTVDGQDLADEMVAAGHATYRKG